MPRETTFQGNIIRVLRKMFPGCIILKNDAGYLQGVPDILILWFDKWAALEIKNGPRAALEPNQKHYVSLMNRMSFAAFIHPENKESVLSDLQRAFGTQGAAFVPEPK